MNKKKISPIYRIIKTLVRFFYPKMSVAGTETLPEEPFVIVGNHSKMNGPIACELYSPVNRYTWCAGQMMHLKEVPAYAFADFWSEKPGYIRWFYKLLSFLIAPLSVCVFTNAQTVPVYRDKRILTTFRTSIARLQEGTSLVIFPEHNVPYNHILSEFQEHFVDVARFYYRKTGKELSFVPLYIAPALKTMYYGTPIRFRADAPIEEERRRICTYLMDEITHMAVSLPEHTVVPYQNIPKRNYPSNLPKEDSAHA